MPRTVRLHRFLPRTTAEGPGLRACIWVQGCSIQCEGCAVPFTWTRKAGDVVSVQEIIDQIHSAADIEGITFVGGEPFEQAASLAEIAEAARAKGLSVVTFTGFTLEAIRAANRRTWNRLLTATDLLIDGPFRKDLPETRRPWVGSSNQRFHFLTARYAHLAQRLNAIPNRLEIRVRSDGTIEINGMASGEILAHLSAY